MNNWIKNAIFYQIYPISFYDSNGDGIGDLNGITEKLSYIADMGYNAIWICPFYKSPFMDGGYDVEDYFSVDSRFGEMEDFENLLAECKRLKIRVIIDLVIGHTSWKHKWFVESAKDEINNYSDYYIWTESNFNKYKDKTVHGLFPRDGGYYVNYYACQPALNFGFNKTEKSGSEGAYSSDNAWQMKYDDERLFPLREEILKIMKFWLGKGVDGFRVDMANSLVKGCVYNSDNDKDVEGNRWLWNNLISEIKSEYPESVFISEWIYAKNAVGKCGFDVDFYAHDISQYNDLFRSEKGSNLLSFFEKGHSYFSSDGRGDAKNFFDYYFSDLSAIEGKGYVSIPSGSHDQVRIAADRDEEDIKVIFAFLMTLKHIPFVYYGDEIAIRHNRKINKDGGYIRTGARTPMQWNEKKNKGFSTAEKLYLPIEYNGNSVEKMKSRADSLLYTVKALIAVRKEYSCLNADGNIEILSSGYPLFYTRSDSKNKLLVALNPSENEYKIKYKYKKAIISHNVETNGGTVMKGRSFLIVEL